VLVIAALGLARHAGDMQTGYVAVAAAGMMVCVLSGIPLTVGLYRRSTYLRAAGTSFDPFLPAARRHQRQNMAGALVLFAGCSLGGLHTVFNVPEFSGQWMVALLCLFGGLMVQMYSQAKYLEALG
jgi:hypothetical protein